MTTYDQALGAARGTKARRDIERNYLVWYCLVWRPNKGRKVRAVRGRYGNFDTDYILLCRDAKAYDCCLLCSRSSGNKRRQ